MKRSITYIVCALFVTLSLSCVGQGDEWAWMGGEDRINKLTIYSDSTDIGPGARNFATTWTDSAGNLWLFGGLGHGSSSYGKLNDLWKYDPVSDTWHWLTGSKYPNQIGVYGTQGMAAMENIPGARSNAAGWVDSVGNLYLFGGDGYAESMQGRLNDLWRYSPVNNSWTWIKGSNAAHANATATYGTLGIPDSANTPAGRMGMVTSSDSSGKVWMFGGNGVGAGSTFGLFNDLWRYDISSNTWAWMDGDSVVNQTGNYGLLGVQASSNIPGGRTNAHSWMDSAGVFWVFAGSGRATTSSEGLLNDLWKYEPDSSAWTWVKGTNSTNQLGVYGSLGVTSSSSRPGGRRNAAIWQDSIGDIWMFGGYGRGVSSGANNLIDMWHYSQSTNLWTWIKGNGIGNQAGNYGTQGVPASSNIPGSRREALTWVTNSGEFWLFGGFGKNDVTGPVQIADLWSFSTSTNNWVWVNGSKELQAPGHYLLGPGARSSATTWTDSLGQFWLYGGFGFGASHPFGYLSDMWMYDPSTAIWTLVHGDSTKNKVPDHGTMGTAALSNSPGGRTGSASWMDESGDFWIYGGVGWGTTLGSFADVWKFSPSTSMWTWVQGDTTQEDSTVFGTLGVPSASSTPGGRQWPANWTDTAGNVWLFGGGGRVSTNLGELGDLWRFNPNTNQWTWMGGSDQVNQAGIYGTLGVAGSTNRPGTRERPVFWSDTADNLWLLGGRGHDITGWYSYQNDLWKYSISSNQWTWVNGSDTGNQSGVYGTQGLEDTLNTPGGSSRASAWTDQDGNFWVFGGYGYDASGTLWYLNHLWRYSQSNNTWTWVKGDDHVNQFGQYGTQGVSSPSNTPGAKQWGSTWVDPAGDLWLFGGFGIPVINPPGSTNDLWKFSIDTCDAPSAPIDVTVSSHLYVCPNDSTTITVSGAGTVKWYASLLDSIALDSGFSFTTPNLDSTATFYAESNTCKAGARTAITVVVIPIISISSSPSTGIVCAGDSLTLTATGGVTYNWSGGISNASPFIPSQSSTYAVTVTDTAGCVASDSIEIIVEDSLPIISLTPIFFGCFGDSVSQVTANVTGGTAPYSYSWSNGTSLFVTWGLPAGNYTVTVTDSNGCMAEETATLSQPAILDASIPNQVNITPCFGDSTGTFTATATGGTGSKTFLWSNGETSSTIANLTAGTYIVTVTDSNGCTDTASAMLTEPSMLNIGLSEVNVQCFGDSNGASTAIALGGTGAITFAWSNGDTMNAISNLPVGTYTVTATDSNGCTITATASITQPGLLSVGFANQLDLLCAGDSIGAVTAVTTGGAGVNSFSWSNASTSATLTNAVAGTYSVTVTDANSCTDSASVFLSEPDSALSLSLLSSPALCFGDNNGNATVTAAGGTGSITFIWSNGHSGAMNDSLAGGSYLVTATDANGCERLDSIFVDEPPQLTVTMLDSIGPSCFGDSDGALTVFASGGLGPVDFIWNNNATGTSISNLVSGSYAVTVTDLNGCQDSLVVQLVDPDVLSLLLTANDEVCEGDENASIESTVTGGTTPYSYQWNDAQNQTTPIAIGLAPGSYAVTVLDANGCTTDSGATIAPGTPIPQPDLGQDTTVLTAQSIVLYPGAFDQYAWSDGSSNDSLEASATGTYWVMASDSLGCAGSDTIHVEFWPLGISKAGNTEISIFPNPTDGTIFIQTTAMEWPVEVWVESVSGQIVSKHAFYQESDNQIPLTGASGIYIVHIMKDAAIQQSFKVVKQ